jgi:hypothetical protein
VSDCGDDLMDLEENEDIVEARPRLKTVADLIATLQWLPGSLPIAIPGYENGFDPVFVMYKRSVQRAHDPKWWDGVLVDVDPDQDACEVLVFGMCASPKSLDDRRAAVVAFPEEPH